MINVNGVSVTAREIRQQLGSLAEWQSQAQQQSSKIAAQETGTSPLSSALSPTSLEKLRDLPTTMDILRNGTAAATADTKEVATSRPLVIELTDDDDNVTITQNDDGNLVISNPENDDQIIDMSTTTTITIRGGAGSDTITVDESVTADIRLEGGAGDDYLYGGSGNDTLVGGDGVDLLHSGAGNDLIFGGDGADNIEGGDGNDRIFGNDGADYISGGKGEDTILGGTGRDSLYGGADEDLVFGGSGNDYIDGGLGNDRLFGSAGNDSISGGKGNDELYGGTGSDTLIGATGADHYQDANADDTIITDNPNTIAVKTGANIEVVEIDHSLDPESIVSVNGSDEFRNRVADDMETYRSLASGQAMLEGLAEITERTGNTTTISELDGTQPTQNIRGDDLPTETGFVYPDNNDWIAPYGATTPAIGTNAEVFYNTSVNIPLSEATGNEATPPAVVLFHELSHAYNVTGGTGIDGIYNVPGGIDAGSGIFNIERQAVGLPLGVNHDSSLLTPQVERPGLSDQPTENDLRRELGIGVRVSYS